MNPILFLILIMLFINPARAHAADGEISVDALDDGRYRSYVEIGHGFKIGLRPYVSIETNMDEWTGRSFHPDNVTYVVGGEYRAKELMLSVYHLCSHPVDRSGEILEYNAVKLTWTFGRR